MDRDNGALARRYGAKHCVFSTKSRLPDDLGNGAEVESYGTPVENIFSESMSDDSTASKDGLSTISSSWTESHRPCLNSPYRKSFPVNIAQPLSPTYGNMGKHQFESCQEPLEALESQLVRLALQYNELSESYTDSITRQRQAEGKIEDLMTYNLQLQASQMEYAKFIGISRPNQPLDTTPMHMSSAPYSLIPRQSSVSSIHNHSLLNSTPSQLAPSYIHRHHFPTNHSNGLAECGDVELESSNSHVNIFKKNITGGGTAAESSPISTLSFESNYNAAHYHSRSTSSVSSDLERSGVEKPSGQRLVLPKSISIRSPGYIRVKAGAKNIKPLPAKSPCQPHRLRLAATPPPDIASVSAPAGGDVEYDVYDQGMFKTELCDKWQHTGTCPYGSGCQFAHGVEELRPVIRHPRYKTDLCRMVAAGDKCLYGHRCHFRHALSQEERKSRK